MAESLPTDNCSGCLACPLFIMRFPPWVINWVIARDLSVADLANMERDVLFRELGPDLNEGMKQAFLIICQGLHQVSQPDGCPIAHPNYFKKWQILWTGFPVINAITLKGGITRGSMTLTLETSKGRISGRDHMVGNVLSGIYPSESRMLRYRHIVGVERDIGLVIETRNERRVSNSVEMDVTFVHRVRAIADKKTGIIHADQLALMTALIQDEHYSVIVIDCLCSMDPSKINAPINTETITEWMTFLDERLTNFAESAVIILVELPDDKPLDHARERGFIRFGETAYSRIEIGGRQVTSIFSTTTLEMM